MRQQDRLNERAAKVGGRALWHVDDGWSMFAGPLGHNAMHSHSTPVYIAGLYDSIRLRISDGPWKSCRAAVIRAGTPYEFDAEGSPLAVLYLEPDAGRIDTLAALIPRGADVGGAVLGVSDARCLRSMFERRPPTNELRACTDDLLGFARRRGRRDIDARIARAIESLRTESVHGASVEHAAAAAGLSVSRFQHLFTAEVGVPFRRYRTWQRLRTAIRAAAGGASLTEAAHAAGFADQAHFSRAFRSAFGAPPSRGL